MSGAVSTRDLLRAFVWMRWRLLANGLARRRRSGWQRLGAVAELAGKVVLWSMAAGFALLLAGLAGFLPWLLVSSGSSGASPDAPPVAALLLAVRIVLLGFMAMLLLIPAFQGLSRGSLGRTRLLLLPIRNSTLHGLEVAAHLGDPWLLAIAPALLAVAVGAVAVAPAGSLVMLLAGALFILALAALSASASFAVELLLRNRRRAEALGMVLVLVWIVVATFPGYLESRREAREETVAAARGESVVERAAPPAEEPGERERSREEMARRLSRFPAPLQLLPSEAYARALALSTSGRSGAALLPVAVLALSVVLAFALSRHLWRRLRASPAVSGGRTGAGGIPRIPRLPGLPAEASAIAWSQIRSYSRTMVGRLNLLLGPVIALVLGLTLRSQLARVTLGERFLGEAWTGVALSVGGVVYALLTLQSFAVNQFAVDGAGFSLSLLSPLPPRALVLGKWAAGAVLATTVTLLTSGVMVSFEPAALPYWPAVLLGGLSGYLLLAPVASWISMLLPKAVDLGRLGRDAQPNQLGSLLGTVAIPLVLLPQIAVGAAVFAATRSVWLLTLAEAVCVGIALLLARLLLVPVANALTRRAESIHLALLER